MGALLAFGTARSALAQAPNAQQQLALDIYKELVEINTVTATGDTGRAADAMAARLRAAGFDAADVQVFKPAPRKGNLVARLRGTGVRNADDKFMAATFSSDTNRRVIGPTARSS